MAKVTGTALVTGGNRGIGLEVCRQLGRLGMRVLLTARDIAAGAEATAALRSEGLDVTFEPLDVASQESIDQLTDRLERQGIRLAALVNNAGITLNGFDADVAERTLAVNFFGAMHVTQRLLPLMEEHGRIVMVSSGAGELEGLSPTIRQRIDPPASQEELVALLRSFIDDVRGGRYAAKGWPGSAYRVSKLGLNALTRLLAGELKPRHLLVNAVCPGWVRTRMGGAQAPRSVEEGADTIVWAATLPPRGPSGGFFRNRRAIPW
ncbi:SDR family oxidoreductase [Vitiosangium sp. GDMCC 1.1324]|uniref:SDR family oxidoreductase n=1 Tax=Vitiosangium sp. (strain GDMCC 1.1324) TaxID=2138576 RepID=UPI000D394763|nr:SDR family oxidoreductase [Vitiosangium sp. GDMCC 1.1324]PTL76394.1 3-oxoacyl-ACP reductase [Vitiosangium sp. GDMCC 1.1324]